MRTIKSDDAYLRGRPSRQKKAFIIFGGIIAVFIASFMYTIISDHTESSITSLPEFDTLFTKDTQNKLSIMRTVKTRNREPVSTYAYNKEFKVCVIKVRLLNNSSLRKILDLKSERSDQWMNAVYSQLPSNGTMKINLKAGKEIIASTIHFKIIGGNVDSVISNDNLYCYSFKFDTFSIRYDDEPYDIIATGDKEFSQIQTAFIKNGNLLYIVLLNADIPSTQMQSNLLYSMINK